LQRAQEETSAQEAETCLARVLRFECTWSIIGIPVGIANFELIPVALLP
jgi:uncharacterized membrane protein YccF (DUF307 family)